MFKHIFNFNSRKRRLTVWGQGVEKASRLQDDESYPLEL